MIDLLVAREALTSEHAYILCSVTADLRISEVVNRPSSVISLYFPRIVLQWICYDLIPTRPSRDGAESARAPTAPVRHAEISSRLTAKPPSNFVHRCAV